MNYIHTKKYAEISADAYPVSKYKNISRLVFASFKDFSDFILSILGLIVASPIMLIIAILIKLDSKGPVFFRQERTGKGGQNFTLYKFRTMSADNDVHDFSKKDKHTKVGAFLRKTSLDEIPQLICIAKGDMSFIRSKTLDNRLL